MFALFNIKEELKRLPDSPGVYLMKDTSETIIYVGKAKSLRKRVRQYFQNKNNLHPKVLAMVSHIERFDYVLVHNEVEALVLEANLIKEYHPHYNILLRDDKQYPYIKITNEKYPRLLKVRRLSKDGAQYFGPYPSAGAVNDMITMFENIYPLRNCTMNFEKNETRKRPCLNYFLGKCLGPCVGKGDEETYLSYIKEIVEVLKGNSRNMEAMLIKNMHEASQKMEFERAARIRDMINHIDVILEKQSITTVDDLDMDGIAVTSQGNLSEVQIFFVRGGKIVGREKYLLHTELEETDEEILSAFIKQFYMQMNYVPGTVVTNIEPGEKSQIEDFLAQKRGKTMKIQVPKRGRKKSLIDMIYVNAKESLVREINKKDRACREKNTAIKQLEQLLEIPNIYRIEAYDISNISGTLSVGSMIVYEDGKKTPREYRKFRIKTIQGADDYGSLKEVLLRRFNHYIKDAEENKFSKKPDILMMDGGKGQVRTALEVLNKFNLDIPVCGLVKDDKHNTRGIIFNQREILLPVTSEAFRLVYDIQEEAHRFAINYHRSLRKKEMVKSVLDEIPGVGKTRRNNLLNHFGSVVKIKEATVEEIESVQGISHSLAIVIYEFFRR